MDTFPDDCLPPECEYDSREALFQAVNAWAAPRGYAFSTLRSTKKHDRLTVTLGCDKARSQTGSSKERIRLIGSQRTACPFSILAKESVAGKWIVQHRPSHKFSIHNHVPSLGPVEHRAHRKISLSEWGNAEITRLTNSGVEPKEILSILRKAGVLVNQCDIYNKVAEVRRNAREGLMPVNVLLNQLNEHGYWNKIEHDSDRHVTRLFFAHPESIDYLRAYPEVIILDCTYKTNQYNMPLVNIVGVDALCTPFCVAFAFLSDESEIDYTWALNKLLSLYKQHDIQLPSVILTHQCLASMNAAEIVFPSIPTLLCLWHTNKEVLTRCKSAFPDIETWKKFNESWLSIINSPTEEVYENRLSEFQQNYTSDYLQEVDYIETTWLIPFKTKLVKAWVDQHRHFGYGAASRVKGIDSLIKSNLNTSKCDLFNAWKAIHSILEKHLSQMKSNQLQKRSRIPLDVSAARYDALRGRISHDALRKVEKHRKETSTTFCTGTFTRVHGLPCQHFLTSLQGEPLLPSHFHSHWRYKWTSTSPWSSMVLLEPRKCTN